MTRLEARAEGRTRYSGLRCEACGHDERYTANNGCAHCDRKRKRDRYAANPEHFRQAERKTRYGIEPAEFDALWVRQSGLCAICSEGLTRGVRGFALDHEHSTGRVRGLLCPPCNTGIGLLREDPAIFTAAVAYLEQHRAARPARTTH